MKTKRRQVLIRIHPWMYDALQKEGRARMIPASVNRLVLEAILAKYKTLSRNMNDDKAVAQATKEIRRKSPVLGQ